MLRLRGLGVLGFSGLTVLGFRVGLLSFSCGVGM